MHTYCTYLFVLSKMNSKQMFFPARLKKTQKEQNGQCGIWRDTRAKI